MRYVLTLEPKPGTDEIRALRAALKALGRRFGLRCVEIRPEIAPDGIAVAHKSSLVSENDQAAV